MSLPAESGVVGLAVESHAVFGSFFLEVCVGVPAVLVVLALEVVVAALVESGLFGASGFEGPLLGGAAVEAVVTVSVVVAVVVFLAAGALLFLAVARLALELLFAVTARQQVLLAAENGHAEGVELFVVELGVVGDFWIDEGLVNPGELAASEVELAEKRFVAGLGLVHVEALACVQVLTELSFHRETLTPGQLEAIGFGHAGELWALDFVAGSS